MWGIIKKKNIHIMEVSEGKGEEKERKLIWSNVAENFPYMDRDIAIQVHEAQKSSNTFNQDTW